MNYKIIGAITILFLVFAGGWWAIKSGYRPPREQTLPPAEKTSPPPTTEVRELTVIGDEYRFQPSSIALKSGERVKLTFKNNGRTPHNLIIEELGIGTKTIADGQTETIEFTAPATGTYAFFCSVPGHRASGMEGSLTVE